MTTYFKLTDESGRTFGGTQWGVGVMHSGTSKSALCGLGWIHVYTHPLLASFFNPIHANFDKPLIWRGEASGKINDTDFGCKIGIEHFTTIECLGEPPKISANARIRAAILLSLKCYKEAPYVAWAYGWLDGSDRSAEAAKAADEAVWAARDATEAVWAARDAARAAETVETAAWAARAAARAAKAAAWTDGAIFVAFIERAIREEAEFDARAAK